MLFPFFNMMSLMKGEFIAIAYWCDDVWCYQEDLEEYLRFKSDDVTLVCLPATLGEEDIEKFVTVMNSKGITTCANFSNL